MSLLLLFVLRMALRSFLIVVHLFTSVFIVLVVYFICLFILLVVTFICRAFYCLFGVWYCCSSVVILECSCVPITKYLFLLVHIFLFGSNV